MPDMARMILIAALSAITGPVLAQDSNDALIACSARPDRDERLDCYDKLVAGLSDKAAEVARKRAAVEQELVASKKQAAFGREGMTGFGGDEHRVQEMAATITQVQPSAGGRLQIALDNGQVWRQAEVRPFPPAKVGASVTIKRGSLGSYILTAPGSSRVTQIIRVR